jgi:hypothetical protein
MWWVNALSLLQHVHPHPVHVSSNAPSKANAKARGQTTKVVRCETCKRTYAYEMKRTARGSADGSSPDPRGLARQRAEEDLRCLLDYGVEAIPCPGCGWYQSNMIPRARSRHRRWMLYLGQFLTLGLIPLAAIAAAINGCQQAPGKPPPVPWLVFAGLVCPLAVGVGLLLRKYNLTRSYDPNTADVEARIRYGQSRAVLVTEQKAKELLAQAVLYRSLLNAA